jgi:hypothetical protein
VPREAAVEPLAPAQLQADVTRLVAKQLASRLRLAGPAGARQSREAADLEIAAAGERFAVELKRLGVTTGELLDAVYAAIAEMFDANTQLLRLRTGDPELAPVISAVVEQVPRAVQARRQALTEQHIDALVDVYMANDPLSPALPDLERDNAEAQARFLKQWKVLTADDVAERAGHGSKNRSATASRWKRAGRIFGVRSGGREVYPAFQFKDGAPRPAVCKVLAALPRDMSGWQTAFWFVGPNGWLDGAAPVERLDDEAALVAAARREDDAWMG